MNHNFKSYEKYLQNHGHSTINLTTPTDSAYFQNYELAFMIAYMLVCLLTISSYVRFQKNAIKVWIRNRIVNDADGDNVCCLCLSSLTTGTVCRLQQCKHEFHVECIRQLIEYSSIQNTLSCPLCRHPIVDVFPIEDRGPLLL
jgi:hypothetical protein